jgi:hypothetical protein
MNLQIGNLRDEWIYRFLAWRGNFELAAARFSAPGGAGAWAFIWTHAVFLRDSTSYTSF